jgi:hypothetical protein
MRWMWCSAVGETTRCIVCFSDLSSRMMEDVGSFRYVSSALRHIPEDDVFTVKAARVRLMCFQNLAHPYDVKLCEVILVYAHV